MTTGSYDIASHFVPGKTYYWAQYVDKKENGGNSNGKVDGKEIQLFKDIFKHRYNGFVYDFAREDSEQALELENTKYLDGEAAYIAENLYHKPNLLKGEGSDALGYRISNQLDGFTGSYNSVKTVIEKIATFPVEAKNMKLLKTS